MAVQDKPAHIQSYVDRCDEEIVCGWALVAGEPDTKPCVDIFYAGSLLATCVANQYRQDLRDAKIGDGYQGFSFQMPLVPKGEVGRIEVKIRHPEHPLHRAP